MSVFRCQVSAIMQSIASVQNLNLRYLSLINTDTRNLTPETYLRPEAIRPKLSGRHFAFFNCGWSDGLRYDCLLGLLENAVKTRGRAGVGLASDVGK